MAGSGRERAGPFDPDGATATFHLPGLEKAEGEGHGLGCSGGPQTADARGLRKAVEPFHRPSFLTVRRLIVSNLRSRRSGGFVAEPEAVLDSAVACSAWHMSSYCSRCCYRAGCAACVALKELLSQSRATCQTASEHIVVISSAANLAQTQADTHPRTPYAASSSS